MAPRLHFLLLLTVVASRCAVADGDNEEVLCSTAGNYTNGSQYHRNLDRILQIAGMDAATNGGYFNGKIGVAPDEVFVLFMCYADGGQDARQDCLNFAPTGITEVCPHSRTVRAVCDACLLRYSDESFFYVADLNVVFYDHPQAKALLSNYYYQRVIDARAHHVVDTDSMNSARFELMNQVTDWAAHSPLQLAINDTPYWGAQRMYGLAQCTRDLPPSECTRCLSSYTRQLPGLFPNNSLDCLQGFPFPESLPSP